MNDWEKDEINAVATVMIEAWKKAEPHHSITENLTSYVATFADMARAVVGRDVCDQCDENGMIYVPRGADGEREEAEMCPACDGTRRGVVARAIADRDEWHRAADALLARNQVLVQDCAAWRERGDRKEAELEKLRALIDGAASASDFLRDLQLEAAHQIERWGVEHDAGKRPEDWFTLMTYLLGKAARAHFDGNRAKLLHHIVTGAAVFFNWWRRETGAEITFRPGKAAPDGE